MMWPMTVVPGNCWRTLLQRQRLGLCPITKRFVELNFFTFVSCVMTLNQHDKETQVQSKV